MRKTGEFDATAYQREYRDKVRRKQGIPTREEYKEVSALYRAHTTGVMDWDTFISQVQEVKEKHRV